MAVSLLFALAISTPVPAGSIMLDRPIPIPSMDEPFQYDDGTANWLTWVGLYRGVWFNTRGFVPRAGGARVGRPRILVLPSFLLPLGYLFVFGRTVERTLLGACRSAGTNVGHRRALCAMPRRLQPDRLVRTELLGPREQPYVIRRMACITW